MDDTYDPPRIGDVLKLSVKGRYLYFTVFRVDPMDDKLQRDVFASAKGLGTVKCKWLDGRTTGTDNQHRTYHVHRRA